MPIDPNDRQHVIDIATRVATRGGDPEQLERLAALTGVDTQAIGQGEGDLDAVMAVLMLPAEQVARLLPVGLGLAPNPLAPVGKHPVLVQLSHWRFEFGDMDYREMMLAVPYVQLSSFDAPRRGPFLYMPRLYLDAELPRLLGVYLYGYEKEAAEIIDQPPQPGRPGRYRVGVEGTDALRLAATIEAFHEPAEAPSAFPVFTAWRQLLEMPTISQAARIWDADAAASDTLSPMLASNLVYRFDAPEATIEPVGLELTIGSRFTPRGLSGTYRVPPLPRGPYQGPAMLGAFRTRVKVGVALPSSPATLRYPVPPPARRQRVLVLGGGPAACAAAYWLARQRDRYEVQLYTQGFRLGGKCAAGRNPQANDRIEEHGLHAFLGFYQNAFRTVRNVYETVGIPIEADGAPLGGAFVGSNQNGLMIDFEGRWIYRRTPLYPNDRIPGQVPEEARDDDGDVGPDGNGSVTGMGELLLEAFRHVARQTEMMERRSVEVTRAVARRMRERDDGIVARLVDRLRDFGDSLTDSWTPTEIVRYIATYLENRAVDVLEGWLADGPKGPLGPVIAVVRLYLDRLDAEVKRDGHDPDVWYRWMSLSSVLTAVIGIIEDRVTHLDQLDDQDTWAWFKEHGLDPRLLPEDLRDEPVEGGQVQGSPAIAAVYETLFAHAEDRPVPRQLAAGVGLRWFFLSAVGYAGYPAYEFMYSAPQTLLTPYYKALTGPLEAQVCFFHRVLELEVEGEGEARRLVRVRLQRQATVKGGPHAYDPFLPNPPPSNPSDLPPWPIEPNYDQLVEGERLRTEHVDLESPYSPWPGVGEVVLEQGRDFDVCILGIALGALPPLTQALWSPESRSHDPRWARMFDDIAITQTISLQLWFDHPESALYDMGVDVDGNPDSGRGLLTGYVLPEPSMGDFTHLLEWEGWPQDHRPKFLAYHTGSLTAKSVHALPPFSDHEYPERTNAAWRAHARQWLMGAHTGFYSKAPSTWEGFVGWLSVPSNTPPNADRFDVQYFNAGPQPSDHYVLSQPKGMAARMGQMESGVTHLYLCGDWTRTDMNCGCVEAATQSGMLCARGLSGHPVYVWHPGV